MDNQHEENDWDYSHEDENNERDTSNTMSNNTTASTAASSAHTIGATGIGIGIGIGMGMHAIKSGIATHAVLPPPPQRINNVSTSTTSNPLGNVADDAASSSTKRCKSSSRKQCASNSQALLRAKASLTCPASYAKRASNTHSSLSLTSATVGTGPALPIHRNFGLAISTSTSTPACSSILAATMSPSNTSSDKPRALTKGEWKEVEVIQNPFNDVETSSPPCARSLHTAAVWNDQMFIFGGYDGTQRRNDFYSFHFKNKEWALISVRGTPPSPRDRHCAVVYGNAFYVFGGFDGSARTNDFYKFDIVTGEWNRIIPNVIDSTMPTPRHSHSAVVYKDSMWVFGGYDGSYRCDLYEYNFITNVWSVIETAGRIPRPRYRAACVVHKDSLILHGGHDGTRHLADTHQFDFDRKSWTSLIIVGTPPVNRDSHLAFVYNNAMYVFGGSAGGTAMNDLHELLLESSDDGFVPVW